MSQQQGRPKTHYPGHHRLVTSVLLTTLILSGCSASGLMIRYLYSRLDNILVERMLSYADFSGQQEFGVRESVAQFSNWHRYTELPRYADFIDAFVARLVAAEMTEQTTYQDFDKMRDFLGESFRNSPIYDSADFLQKLTDKQVNQVAERFSDQDARFMEWYEQRKQDPGRKKQLATIVKNLRRIGIQLRQEQQDIIASGLLRYQGTPLERHEVWGQWEEAFIELLRLRQQADFAVMMNSHLAVYQDQMKLAYPDREHHNRQNTVKTVLAVMASLDSWQQAKLIKRLRQASTTLRYIAKAN